ncbi:hypothetical protein BDK51DRAFT_44381 [Blyttiomyces helicus]|uniref:Uncharacterized protein n=1 Tax=Blyttiomyces helicus TaxID=388810 RepID=A0A4P9WJ48_9FUNG|nr:hypothetical protein BDK51DRAFT_44381 [Blyttiomyces helicus]|eukprot:RKO92075.1 hypothetical protein BDK51DRAFT_44381 [Blyttiomyces helicus]
MEHNIAKCKVKITVEIPAASSFPDYPKKSPWAIITFGCMGNTERSEKSSNPEFWKVMEKFEKYSDISFSEMFHLTDEDITLNKAFKDVLRSMEIDGEKILPKTETIYPAFDRPVLKFVPGYKKSSSVLELLRDSKAEIDIRKRIFHIPKLHNLIESMNYEGQDEPKFVPYDKVWNIGSEKEEEKKLQSDLEMIENASDRENPQYAKKKSQTYKKLLSHKTKFSTCIRHLYPLEPFVVQSKYGTNVKKGNEKTYGSIKDMTKK